MLRISRHCDVITSGAIIFDAIESGAIIFDAITFDAVRSGVELTLVLNLAPKTPRVDERHVGDGEEDEEEGGDDGEEGEDDEGEEDDDEVEGEEGEEEQVDDSGSKCRSHFHLQGAVQLESDHIIAQLHSRPERRKREN